MFGTASKNSWAKHEVAKRSACTEKDSHTGEKSERSSKCGRRRRLEDKETSVPLGARVAQNAREESWRTEAWALPSFHFLFFPSFVQRSHNRSEAVAFVWADRSGPGSTCIPRARDGLSWRRPDLVDNRSPSFSTSFPSRWSFIYRSPST